MATWADIQKQMPEQEPVLDDFGGYSQNKVVDIPGLGQVTYSWDGGKYVPKLGSGNGQETWLSEGKDGGVTQALQPRGDTSLMGAIKDMAPALMVAFGGPMVGGMMSGAGAMSAFGAGAAPAGWTSGFDLAGGGGISGWGAAAGGGGGAITAGVGEIAGGGSLAAPGGYSVGAGGGTTGVGASGASGGVLGGSGGGGSMGGVWDTFMSGLAKNPISSALQIGSGIAGLVSGGMGVANAGDQRDMADPWGASGGRGQAIEQLRSLISNPGSVASTPGYQFMYEQGLQGLNRNLAAKGKADTGAAGIAQQQYGQAYAMNSYKDWVTQLAGIAGANQNPASGASAYQNAQDGGYKAMAQGLGTLASAGQSPQPGAPGGGSAMAGIYGNSGGSNNSNPDSYYFGGGEA